MKRRISFLFIALVIATVSSAAAERPAMPPKLTLPRALSIAFENAPALRLADSALVRADAVRRLARAERLPHVGVEAGRGVMSRSLEQFGISAEALGGRGSLPRKVGPFDAFDARAGVTQEVINLPLRYRHRAEATRNDAARDEVRDVRENLALGVVSAYVGALRAQAVEATLSRQLALARQLYTITTDRFEQGVASGLDKRRARQQLNNLQQLLLEAEAALTSVKLELANVIHARISAAYELDDIRRFYDASAMSAAEAVGVALDARADYQAALKQLRAAEFDVRGAKAVKLPRLVFHADYGAAGRQINRGLSVFTVQGTLAIPIYFGGRASAEKALADSGAEAARARLEELRARIETETLSAHAQVESARRQIEVAKESIELGREEVDLTTARFLEGVADNSEVVLAQDRLARAEANRVRALYNLNISRANLNHAIGRAEKAYRK